MKPVISKARSLLRMDIMIFVLGLLAGRAVNEKVYRYPPNR